MKLPTLTLGLLLTLTGIRLEAITLPVLEDTSSRNGFVTKGMGAAGNLSTVQNRPSFVRFDLGTLTQTSSTTINRARLILFVQKVIKPGSVTLHAVTSDWSEFVQAATPRPTIDSEPLATIAVSSETNKQFVTVDVTTQVQEWLAAPETDFGFSMASDGAASIILGAKEGPGSGYPAVLEIEQIRTIDDHQIASGVNVSKLGDGTIENEEFAFLDGVTGAIQLQIDGIASELADVQTLTATINGKVSKAGDTMTGPLALPANALVVGSDQLVVGDNRIGIGTSAPNAKLDVRGDVRLGATGQLFAPGGDENLRIIRGTVRNSGGVLTVESGSGFTISGLVSNGISSGFNVTFTTPFPSKPTITVSLEIVGSNTSVGTKSVTPNGAFIANGNLDGTALHFIAIGTR